MGSRPTPSTGEVRVSLLQEVLFALHVCLVGVSESGHYTAQGQESLTVSLATNKAFFILGRKRPGNECVTMVTS